MQAIADQRFAGPAAQFGCVTGEWCTRQRPGARDNRGGKCPAVTVWPAGHCAAGHRQCRSCRCCPCCTTCGCYGCSAAACRCHRPTWQAWRVAYPAESR